MSATGANTLETLTQCMTSKSGDGVRYWPHSSSSP
jgi:hypothetical protein